MWTSIHKGVDSHRLVMEHTVLHRASAAIWEGLRIRTGLGGCMPVHKV